MNEELPLSIDALVLRAPMTTPDLTAAADLQGDAGHAQSRLNAESVPTGVCVGPAGATQAPGAPMPLPTPTASLRPANANSKVNPYRPQTSDDIAIFARLWHDPAYTLAMIGRRYRCNPRTIQKWAASFALGPRDGTETSHTLDGSSGEVAAAIDQAMFQALPGPPRPVDQEAQNDVRFNPLADSEIRVALEDLQREALNMTTHSDLAPVQRKLARLSLLLASKAPRHSWPSLQDAMETLGRVFLQARKVEAQLPVTGADPVVLRKEAAAQLFKELKNVLNAEEQVELGRLVKLGADRMMGHRQPGVSEVLNNQALR